jgi:hypothetical protein
MLKRGNGPFIEEVLMICGWNFSPYGAFVFEAVRSGTKATESW